MFCGPMSCTIISIPTHTTERQRRNSLLLWWGILGEEVQCFHGHPQAAHGEEMVQLWSSLPTKTLWAKRELSRQPHLNAHKHSRKNKERANCSWNVVISQHRSLWGCSVSPERLGPCHMMSMHPETWAAQEDKHSWWRCFPLKSNIWLPSPDKP